MSNESMLTVGILGHADEGRPEVKLAEELVHLAACRLGEPVIDSGEHGEDRSGGNDIMEVPDDVVGIVQVDVGAGQAQRQTGQPADGKHRQERRRKEHGRIEAN